jgi:hypothetical protein
VLIAAKIAQFRYIYDTDIGDKNGWNRLNSFVSFGVFRGQLILLAGKMTV